MTETSTTQPTRLSPLSLPIHHLGYAVDNLEEAILDAARTLGAGPFFLIKNIPLTSTSSGEPAVFAHSSAFGQWGETALEFMQIEHCEPQQVADAMRQPTPALNHIAYAAPSLGTARDALTDLGLPPFLQSQLGDIEFSMHNARAVCGHNIELHDDNPSFRAFWGQIRAASIGWDGRDPIRAPAM